MLHEAFEKDFSKELKDQKSPLYILYKVFIKIIIKDYWFILLV